MARVYILDEAPVIRKILLVKTMRCSVAGKEIFILLKFSINQEEKYHHLNVHFLKVMKSIDV